MSTLPWQRVSTLSNEEKDYFFIVTLRITLYESCWSVTPMLESVITSPGVKSQWSLAPMLADTKLISNHQTQVCFLQKLQHGNHMLLFKSDHMIHHTKKHWSRVKLGIPLLLQTSSNFELWSLYPSKEWWLNSGILHLDVDHLPQCQSAITSPGVRACASEHWSQWSPPRVSDSVINIPYLED